MHDKHQAMGGDGTLDRDKLRGILAENRLSQRKMAQILGITDKTFYSKMKKGVFDSDEIAQMIQTLGIEDPAAIFFKNVGA